MGQAGTKLRRFSDVRNGSSGLSHWCPGCNEMHSVTTEGKNSSGASWTWDGNMEAPTFAPSINIRTNAPDMQGYQPAAATSICHYFLRAGVIEFLGDCTHRLKGQTIPLPPLPGHLRDD